MPRLGPSTRFRSGHRRRAEQLIQRLDEEILPPHHTLIHAKVLALVVAAVLEDSFPAQSVDRQELGREERAQDGPRIFGVLRRPLRVPRQRGELQEAAGGNCCGRAFVGSPRRRFLPVVRRDPVWWRALDVEIGAALRRIQEALVARKPVRGAKTIERPTLAPRPGRIVSPALVRRLAQELTRL